MNSAVCFSYSELFDRYPSLDEVIETISWIPMRHAIHVISTTNLAIRYAMQEHGKPNLGKVQEFVIAAHVDDEALGILKTRFPRANCVERPVFLSQNLLALLRLVIAHCDPDTEPNMQEDERARYSIGRACLMLNNLLFTREEEKTLNAGAECDRRLKLMAQAIGGFELTNPTRPDHLVPRLQIMYRVLLKVPPIRSRIARECGGFDFSSEFEARVGLTIERWLFVVLSIWAYFVHGADPFDRRPEHLIINPEVFCGESGITRGELNVVLGTLASSTTDLRKSLASETTTDPRHDFVAFRSRPLVVVDNGRLMPADLSFIADKCHTGVQWTLHDLLPIKSRSNLFSSWGKLFQEYVHWLLTGMETNLLLKYVPCPKWRESGDESFDGVILQGAVFMAAEYKGGFLSRTARYSGNSKILLEDIDKKFAVGCDQLADKIGRLFASDTTQRRALDALPVHHVRSVVPVLVLQDQILRVPFLNWYLNKRFLSALSAHGVRCDVMVRPLTVIGIQDLESAVHSIEGDDFDFVYAIHNRAVRDPEMYTVLGDMFRTYPTYGRTPSPRIKKALAEAQSDWLSYLFPGMNLAS